MIIDSWVLLNHNKLIIKEKAFALPVNSTTAWLYEKMGLNYPKFFKMDELCQWVVMAAEYLAQSSPMLHTKENIAIVLQTHHGCYESDMAYSEPGAIPSPAKFVYTLPNIMLGEIAIRHGVKGEQLCLMTDHADFEQLWFILQDMFQNRQMLEGICGWVNLHNDRPQIALFRIKAGKGAPFTAANMLHIYKNL